MKLFATSLAVLAATTSLQAVKLIGDDFSYTAASPVTSANGGFGWSGAWTTPTITNTASSLLAPGTPFSYTSGGTLNIPASQRNGALQLGSTNSTSNTNALSRNFASALNATEFYVSFMVRYTAGATLADTDSFYLFFGTNNDVTARYDIGIVGAGGTDFAARTSNAFGGGPTPTYTSTGVNIGATGVPATGSYLVVGRLSKGTNYNQFTLWANPTSPIQSQNTAVSSTNATGDFNTFSSLGFGFANLDNTENFQIDNLQIGTTWEDVITPVPFGVDSTAGLALLGLASAWKLRRRRAKA